MDSVRSDSGNVKTGIQQLAEADFFAPVLTMQKKLKFITWITFLSISVFLPANLLSGETSLESTINHLLTYIQESNCKFIRNDVAYDSRDAAEHIKTKYEHFKEDIHTPEDFIERCATRSLLSGKLYFVQCSDNPKKPTADWLMTELTNYRRDMSKGK